MTNPSFRANQPHFYQIANPLTSLHAPHNSMPQTCVAAPRRAPTRLVLDSHEVALANAAMAARRPANSRLDAPPTSAPKIYCDLSQLLTTYPPVVRLYSVIDVNSATPVALPLAWCTMLDELARIQRVGNKWRVDAWALVWKVVEQMLRTHRVEVRCPAAGGTEGFAQRGVTKMFEVPMLMNQRQWLREVLGPASDLLGVGTGAVFPRVQRRPRDV
ncbi:hypothetical protein EDC01DRAFT_731363 [Geopyxis carbonaria]|nr:hypothetical protein EDC01DRAFT_731363 [Geopyxis carbonaria]